MSPRVRALAALVVGLGLLRLGLLAAERAGGDGLPPHLIRRPPDRDELHAADLDRVVLRRGSRHLILERGRATASGPGPWLVQQDDGEPALPAREGVDQLVERLLGWRRERPAGSDPGRHDAWGVSEELARHVQLGIDGRLLAELLVGKITGVEPEEARATGGRLDTARLGLFVRVQGEAATWVVSDFLTRELEPDLAHWVEPPAPIGPPDAARRLAVRRGPADPAAATVLLAPGAAARFEADPRPADPVRVRALLVALASLQPVGAAPPDVTPPADALALEVGLDDGRAVTLRLWPSGEGTARVWLARRDAPAPATLEVEPAGAARVDGLAGDLVRRAVFFGRPEDVVRLHATVEDREWTLAPDGFAAGAPTGHERRWRLTRTGAREPLVSRPVADAAAAAALGQLGGLTVVGWDTTGVTTDALREPRGRLVVLDLDRARIELTLGAEVEGDAGRLVAARVSTAPLPFWLDSAQVRDILTALARLGD